MDNCAIAGLTSRWHRGSTSRPVHRLAEMTGREPLVMTLWCESHPRSWINGVNRFNFTMLGRYTRWHEVAKRLPKSGIGGWLRYRN
jgi:hypothetical protein